MRWRGQSVLIIASGPSLTERDVINGWIRANRTIVVNESWSICPAADVLYAADPDWWLNREPPPDKFPGERWTQDKQWERRPKPKGVQTIRSVPGIGVPGDDFIFQGANSGFQALGLAILWGATKIVLLGFDMSKAPDGRGHWHDDHPKPLRNAAPEVYRNFAAAFAKAAPAIQERGVLVLNASRQSVLTCFPRVDLVGALP